MYGVITLATAFINTRAEFLTIRFLLGVFEGATLREPPHSEQWN
jgi:hypothetical protein